MRGHRKPPSATQMSLDGLEAKPPSERLFFAVFPDPRAQQAIALETDALRVEHALHGRPIEPSRLHATLHHLGDHPELRDDLVEAARTAAGQVALAPFEMTLASASSFSSGRGNHPCVLLCPEERPPLHALWRELGTQLMAAGLGRYLQRAFTPHVTLLYDRHALLAQTIEPIRWTVRDFALVQSQIGRHEHHILGTWMLR